MNGPHLFERGHLVRSFAGDHALVVDAGNLAAILQRPVPFAPHERIEVEQGDPEWTVVATAPGFCDCCREYVGEGELVDGTCDRCWDVLTLTPTAAERGVAVARYLDGPWFTVARIFHAAGRSEQWVDMLEAGALSVPRPSHFYPEGTER